MQYTIKNVKALWPRINKTYKYSAEEQRSVPCDAKDPNAAYEMSFKMTRDQAKVLLDEMRKAYASKRKPEWPEDFNMPFKKDGDEIFIGKAKLKGNYNGELTNGVGQYDAKGNKLADDFMLTTDSTVNVAVTFVPYNMRDAGVSLRLRAVQVLEHKPLEQASPFAAMEGFVSIADTKPADDPFGLPASTPTAAVIDAPASGSFDDEIPF